MSASERSETAKSYCEFGEALFNFVGIVILMSFSIIAWKKKFTTMRRLVSKVVSLLNEGKES